MAVGRPRLIAKPFGERAVRDALETAMGWHDATVASGPQPEDAAERIHAWLEGLDEERSPEDAVHRFMRDEIPQLLLHRSRRPG